MFQGSEVPRVAVALIAVVVAVSAQTPRATLTGFAVMPPETFAPGPPSGAWIQAGKEGVPQFPSQPVQGFSAVWPAEPGGARVVGPHG